MKKQNEGIEKISNRSETAKEKNEGFMESKPSVSLKYPECIHLETKCMLKRTDQGHWDDIWYVSNNTNIHLCSKLSLFCNIKEKFVANNLDDQMKFLFTYGLGEVVIKNGDQGYLMPGVSYASEVTLNILLIELLERQGFEIIYEDNTCRLIYMFKDPKDHKFNEDKLRVMYNKYLEEYFESLDSSAEQNKSVGLVSMQDDVIETKGTLYSTKVTTFNEYIAFLNLVKQDEIISQQWDKFKGRFDKVLKWFYKSYLGKPLPGPIPPKLNGVQIHLFGLYKLIEGLRGYLSIYFGREFGIIGETLGLSKQDGEQTVEEGKEYTCHASHQCDFGKSNTPNLEATNRKGKEKIKYFGVKLEEEEYHDRRHFHPIQPNKNKESTLNKGIKIKTQAAHQLLEHITFVDTPGVLSGEKQRTQRSYDFTGVTSWFAAECDLILILFDPHKLDINDEFKRVIASLRGDDDKVRVVLNKADQVNTQQINEFVKRARAAKIHAFIISHLKKEMPSMMGKAKAQQKLIDNLEDVFAKMWHRNKGPLHPLKTFGAPISITTGESCFDCFDCFGDCLYSNVPCTCAAETGAEGKGWVLELLRTLLKGTFVCEYIGDIVTNTKLLERMEQNKGCKAYIPCLVVVRFINHISIYRHLLHPPTLDGLDAFIAKKKRSKSDFESNGSPEVQTSPSSNWFTSSKSAKKVSLSNVTSIIDGLKKLYIQKLKPLEQTYQFNDFVSPLLTNSDFDAKPMVMLLGQYSTGKTTFIKHLLRSSYPGAHIGPEPTTDRFVVVMNGPDERSIPGNTVAVQADMPYSGLTNFGTAFLSKFECSQMPHPDENVICHDILLFKLNSKYFIFSFPFLLAASKLGVLLSPKSH
nr:EH domain-containing protein 1-like [Tanacetum cinerariifolium]